MFRRGFKCGLHYITDVERIRSGLGPEVDNQTYTHTQLEVCCFYASRKRVISKVACLFVQSTAQYRDNSNAAPGKMDAD
jgi:hypothetical protein